MEFDSVKPKKALANKANAQFIVSIRVDTAKTLARTLTAKMPKHSKETVIRAAMGSDSFAQYKKLLGREVRAKRLLPEHAASAGTDKIYRDSRQKAVGFLKMQGVRIGKGIRNDLRKGDNQGARKKVRQLGMVALEMQRLGVRNAQEMMLREAARGLGTGMAATLWRMAAQEGFAGSSISRAAKAFDRQNAAHTAAIARDAVGRAAHSTIARMIEISHRLNGKSDEQEKKRLEDAYLGRRERLSMLIGGRRAEKADGGIRKALSKVKGINRLTLNRMAGEVYSQVYGVGLAVPKLRKRRITGLKPRKR